MFFWTLMTPFGSTVSLPLHQNATWLGYRISSMPGIHIQSHPKAHLMLFLQPISEPLRSHLSSFHLLRILQLTTLGMEPPIQEQRQRRLFPWILYMALSYTNKLSWLLWIYAPTHIQKCDTDKQKLLGQMPLLNQNILYTLLCFISSTYVNPTITAVQSILIHSWMATELQSLALTLSKCTWFSYKSEYDLKTTVCWSRFGTKLFRAVAL